MFTNKHPSRARLILLTSVLLVTSSCNSGSSTTQNTPPVDEANPPDAPAFVAVVAGDDHNGEIQNTISWLRDPAATGYTVYWANAPGVTGNSSVVVPTLSGTNYVVHSGVDVLAGNTYYYRVQAQSADGDSDLSAEVSGTPQQAVTNNALSDVAWNGIDTLVAVGDSGVILSSPDGTSDPWSDVSLAAVPVQLTGVTWENVNAQFLVVGAGNTVLTSNDGINFSLEDLGNLPGASNLQDVAWLGDRYVAVGNNATILTSNADGSAWQVQDAGPNLGTTAFNAVAANDNAIVIVGTNGTVLNSNDAITWELQPAVGNNDLNDITWDGNQFTIVGSNDTILTSPDGLAWTAHLPGTADINFVAVTQWDHALPPVPVLAAVGSAGTFVIDPDADPGIIIRTGTTRQLGGITWVDDGIAPAYFVMVGSDGTVLTAKSE